MYLSCVVTASICYVDTLTPLLFLYITNTESAAVKNEIYHAVYDHMTEIILHNSYPMIQLSYHYPFSLILVVSLHFFKLIMLLITLLMFICLKN